MTQLIGLNPEPPTREHSVTICYEFPSGVESVTITVSFSPSGDSSNHTLTLSQNCVTVTVPVDAAQITVSDSSGVSPDKVSNVLIG